MRTNIDIDDKLLQKAMNISHLKTKKAVVEMALQEYIALMNRRDLLNLRGKVTWVGDLDEMRTDPRLNEWDE